MCVSTITDAELDIMKALWKNGPSTSPDIFAGMSTDKSTHIGTKRTLLLRLVKKGAINRRKINERHYIYSPAISEEEYINENRKWMINRIFSGSVEDMLANLIKEEKISHDDLKLLLESLTDK